MTGKRAPELRRLISCHKAGHAVVARNLGVEIADIDRPPKTIAPPAYKLAARDTRPGKTVLIRPP